ncbi:pre-rRNA-processing protein esf1 [Coemansia sp. RSA 1933]|nr:pre-rRNA-processing protein esf1 [Coemansia sp. RSA 1933]
MTPPQQKSNDASSSSRQVTSDPRFSHVQNDPRFSRPKKAQSKVKLDKRFAHMIKDKAFTESTKVDRYGRATDDNRAKAYLNRTYDFSGESEEEGSEDQGEESKAKHKVDDGSEDESSEEEDDDESDAAVDRARGHGVDSDESSDSELDSDISDVEWGKIGGMNDEGLSDLDEDPDDIPRGDETKRFACINMDWNNVRAVDLLAVFSGFTPDGGSVIAVKVYPSEFGKEQMAKEETEGPPREMFKRPTEKASAKLDEEEDSDDEKNELINEQVQEEEEIDHVAMRRYEIQKMRYYFAIVECDSVETAKAICTLCDGSEYESSANFFDLRYVPDEMAFDDAPRDEAMHVPEKYKPLDFVTHALMNSKAEISWDADAPSRSVITRRNLTHDDIDNLDFDNLLASASSSGGSDDDSDNEAELARKRNLLLMGASKDSDEDEDNDANIGDMQITFTPGLSESASARIDADQDDDSATRRSKETPIERFHRVKKERRDRWKEIQKSKKPGNKGKRADDNDNLISDNEYRPTVAGDAFFTLSDDERDGKARSSSNNSKNKRVTESKSERKKRLEARDKERAELELLLDGPEAGRKHFDISEIVKAEKNKGRKGKRGKMANDVQDDFKLDTSDPRFGALYESHNFALDPNNPNFKKTKAMKDLLNESRKRRKHVHS